MYAEKTRVPIGRSQDEIRKILTKYGASAFGIAEAADRAMLTFDLKGKRIMFKLPLPKPPPANATSASVKTHEHRQYCLKRDLDSGNISKLERNLISPPKTRRQLLRYLDGLTYSELDYDFLLTAAQNYHIARTIRLFGKPTREGGA